MWWINSFCTICRSHLQVRGWTRESESIQTTWIWMAYNFCETTSYWLLQSLDISDAQVTVTADINVYFIALLSYRLLCVPNTDLCCVRCAALQETPCGEELQLLQTFCQNTPCHDPTSPLRRGAERQPSAHTPLQTAHAPRREATWPDCYHPIKTQWFCFCWKKDYITTLQHSKLNYFEMFTSLFVLCRAVWSSLPVSCNEV